MKRRFLITGGAGFIGSAVIRQLIHSQEYEVICVDNLTYAGNIESLGPTFSSELFSFEKVDICDADNMERVLFEYRPDVVMHLAAESHVDNSISGPGQFIQTNIVGTFTLLEQVKHYLSQRASSAHYPFVFHHVSTDEVYGDLPNDGSLFVESTPYQPSSPYSASKAASDHLVRAWHRTFGIPILVTNCSNNYGPFQIPEKLIPKTISNALNGASIPVYGDGNQIRDWLFVEDHASALIHIALNGRNGQTYNVGGGNEIKNIDAVQAICSILDELAPRVGSFGKRYEDLISFVTDRVGHDRRYAIDSSKLKKELNWKPKESFASGIRKTVEWYVRNQSWCDNMADRLKVNE